MIFASDLDRTLLFSKSSFGGYKRNLECIDVEFNKGGMPLSFMLKESVEMLSEISKASEFIPVSARDISQYDRIRFEEYDIVIRYVILDNGYTVMREGKEDGIWNSKVMEITRKIDKDRLEYYLKELGYRYRISKRSFGYEIGNKDTKLKGIVSSLVEGMDNIKVDEDHKKVYVIFKGIDKLSALRYLIKDLNKDKLISGGDSPLDLEMIKYAEVGFISSAGFLYNNIEKYSIDQSRIFIANKKGPKSSLELLSIVKGYW